jgi:hypothetical protein
VYQSVLASGQAWIPGKPSLDIATLSLEYLDSLNAMIAITLKKDGTLPANARFSEVVEFFELPHVTLDDSKHWGNYYWAFLHYISIYMNIMKDDDTLYGLFYNVIFNLRMILACNACLVNYQSKLEPKRDDPVDAVTIKYTILGLAKTDAIRAIYDLHSLVNQHTAFGKYKDYTFKDFLKAYDLKVASE